MFSRGYFNPILSFLIASCVFTLGAPSVFAADIEGSADYPDVGRFTAASITYYDEREFDEFWFATGPATDRKHGDGQMLEGRVLRIAYRNDAGPSVLQVTRNYENKLTDSGYTIDYRCKDKECGGYNFRYYGTEILPSPAMTANLDDFRYIAATSGGTHISILVSINNGAIVHQVMVVETQAMENSMVDAKAMADSISDTGKIALYGILFDYDSAAIKPESQPALKQIAALMRDRPDLKILVVGHTDNQGGLDYNLGLSTKRAQAIVAALSTTFGIAANRMTPAGAAFLAPVASNRTEAGQAENRRVELVER